MTPSTDTTQNTSADTPAAAATGTAGTTGRDGRTLAVAAPASAAGASGPTLTEGSLVHAADDPRAPWWRHAVIYQVYPRSWADGNGDGIGDLPGIIEHLPYLRDLGVDALWLSPFYPSPQADAGYDVSDYRDVAPLFGELADADRLISTAHELGLKVIVDIVPNHTSDEHVWFQEALAAGPGSDARKKYVFRDGTGPDGNEPPNDWVSVFAGAAWTQVEKGDAAAGTVGQWYLHLFDTKQPDLNWENPEIIAEFHDILRFWLDRGVDGFRVDVAHGLVKDQSFPNWAGRTEMIEGVNAADSAEDHDARFAEISSEEAHRLNGPYWDQDGVHEIYRGWRQVLDSYSTPTGDTAAQAPGEDRIMCAEAWVEPMSRMVRYVRPDEFHQAFNFEFLQRPWRADQLRPGIEVSFRGGDSVGAPTTWVLSNHDVVRHATRLGYGVDEPRRNGIGADDPQPDAALGLRRARAATALMLALPGSAYLYQGEELGLPDHTALPAEVREDPVFERSGRAELGRDGCRVPFPWDSTKPGLGFGPTGATWLPQPDAYRDQAVDRQTGVEGSTLELYRTLLAARKEHDLGTSSLTWIEGYGPDVVAFVLGATDGARTAVVANLGAQPVPLPEGRVVVVSSELEDGLLPQDATAWVAL